MHETEVMLLALSEIARACCGDCPRAPRFDDKGKDLFDPVTELDRSIERAMRSRIIEALPADGVWGEEEGWSNEGAERYWSLDPVDGTRALICGLPSWTVLVGLIEGGEHIAGMIDCPALDERLVAVNGVTSCNGSRVRTSGCVKVAKARLSTTDPYLFSGPEAEAFERVRENSLVVRYGLDALAYARVATGGIDLVIENSLQRHDIDALVPVVRGAGGFIGDWQGGQNWNEGRVVAAATRELYEEAVALLAL
jgi:myo-inositol-1(or 4)-monophosphatase